MATKYIIFSTYQLLSSGGTSSFGYENGVHSNYIGKTMTDSIGGSTLSISFDGVGGFPFLGMSGGTGIGWQADTFNILINIIEYDDLTTTSGSTKPLSTDWRVYNVTDQIKNGTLGNITEVDMHSAMFSVTLSEYNDKPVYDLKYLSYPTNQLNDVDKIAFGEEKYFMGNVKTDIGAMSYTTDIKLKLPSTEFNTSSNATWSSGIKPLISEIGIYDENNILVGIGKFNSPITKDDAIKAISFQLDF